MAQTFDGIIIGSGQHGLILGAYLAKAGLKIALLERRQMYGGGLTTEERTLPGFYHNLHSINHFDLTNTPWYRDLELEATVPYITPRHEFAQPHRDGTALVFSRDIDETCASIAQFSQRDAETFREWNRKGEQMTRKIFLAERFAAPLSKEERESLLETSALGREFLAITRRQPLDVVNELFEHEKVKVLFLFKLSLFGTVLREALYDSSPVGSTVRAFDLTTGYQLCKGGSWNLARGLMERFIAAGGTFLNQVETERIVVTDGRATGVELTDGRTLNARQFVASTVDVHQTFEQFVGREQLPPAYLEKLDRFHYTTWTLFGLHLALNEPPRYASNRFNPHVDVAMKHNIGSETIDGLFKLHADVATRQNVPSVEDIQFGAGTMTLIDPSQAPQGKHTAYAWHLMPLAPNGSRQVADEIRESFAEQILDKWREYAPNLTNDNIVGRYVYTANDYTGQLINMRHGDIFMGALSADQVLYNHWGYRTPIAGLYMAGSPTHPNGAISGGGGYIAAGVIADDLGLKKWWAPVDVRQALEALR